MNRQISILVLDDDPDDAFLIEEALLDVSRRAYDVHCVQTLDAALEAMESRSFDCLLSDFRMGALTGLDVLNVVAAKGIDIPIVVLTSGASDEVDEAVLSAGAADFLTKDLIEPNTLDRAIRYALAGHSRQRLLRMVLDATSSAMMLVDENDEIVLHNARAEALADTLELEGETPLQELVAVSDAAASSEVKIDGRILDRSETPVADGRLVVLHDVTERAEALAERERSQRQLTHMALHDALTGLSNRSGFAEEFDRRMRRAQRRGEPLTLLSFDVNRFKEVNDVHGHSVGDLLLKALAGRLQNAVSREDFVGRLGGDEFVVLLSGREATTELGVQVARRIRKRLGVPFDLDGRAIFSGTSIGVATYPVHGRTAEELLANADVAMYRAKRSKSDGVCAFDASMDAAVRSGREMAEELRTAIDEGLIDVFIQPQVSVPDRTLVGYESLARWTRRSGQAISPGDFIPVAEHTGLIVPLGELMLRRSAEEAAKWGDGRRIAVNVSPIQLTHTDLPALVRTTLFDTGLPAARLELEVTESALIEDGARTSRILSEIRDMGVSIAMDDFGTGYSSLSMLHAFPFDKIKIDRSFIARLDKPKARAIVQTMIALGSNLGASVLSEGVETDEQAAQLDVLGCGEMQGYLTGKPFNAMEITSPGLVRAA